MSLVMSIRGRGPAASATRAGKVLRRFGATSASMVRCLDRYDSITSEHGVRPTLPTTACVLARHPDLLRRLAARDVELAVHGLVHGDHAALDEHQQRSSIARAMEIFADAGLRSGGFRGPYLRYNAATLRALRELGFVYHSSQAVAFPLVEEPGSTGAAERLALALRLYSALKSADVAVTPRLREGLVDIPVAVPDDEILLERLRWEEAARTSQWLHILDLTYRSGELFTLQLHPERIPELGDALATTLADARRHHPAVWIARLDAIAAWWLRRSRFALHVTRVSPGSFRVRLEAEPGATLLTRGLDVPRVAWSGRDAISRSHNFEVASPRVPIVGVSRRSSAELRAFVVEQGFPIEVSDDRDAYGAHIDEDGAGWSETGVLAAIERAPGPLVRIWRWPDGARSALAVTGDIDALTLKDFVMRSWETRASTYRRYQE